MIIFSNKLKQISIIFIFSFIFYYNLANANINLEPRVELLLESKSRADKKINYKKYNLTFNKNITDYNIYNCNNKSAQVKIIKYNKKDLIDDKNRSTITKMLTADSLTKIYIKKYDKSYYLRCLPDDFPVLSYTKLKNNNIDGYLAIPYYARTLTGNNFASNYFIITDTNGSVLWYMRSSGGSTFLDLYNNESLISRGVANGFHPGTPTKYNSAKVTDLSGNLINDLTLNSYLARPTFVTDDKYILMTGSPNRSNVDISKLNITLQDQSNGKCIIDKENVNIAGVSIDLLDSSGKLIKSIDLTDKIPYNASSKANIVNRALPNEPLDCAIDIFHQNSISESEDKKGYILSNRWSGVFYIDKSTEEIIWHIGTYKSEKSLEIISDPLGNKGPIAQHGGYLTKDNRLFIFDNQVEKNVLARGVEYYIDKESKKAIFIKSYILGVDFCVDQNGIFTCNSNSQGNIEVINDKKDILVSWGNTEGREEQATFFNAKGEALATISILSNKPNVMAAFFIEKNLLSKENLRKHASSKSVINNGIYPK